MGTLVDTSVITRAEREALDLAARVPDGEIAIAAMTAAELLRGVHRADPEHRSRRAAVVDRLLARVPTIPFDLRIARIHARLWAELQASGTLIGPADLQIAATALALGWSVATYNVREFGRVPGLTVVALD